MRAYGEDRPQRLAGRFVRLDVDVDRVENAALVERLGWEGRLPAFLVVDPRSGDVVLRMLGKAATAADVSALVAEGRLAIAGRRGADAIAAEAERSAGANDVARAAAEYRRAMETADLSWPGRDRAAANLVLLLSVWDGPGCAREARALSPRMSPGRARATVAFTGLDCATALPKDAPERAAMADLEPATRAALDDPGLHVETRLNMLSSLAWARDAADDREGRRRSAEAYWAVVSETYARAADGPGRAALAYHLAVAAMAADDPGRAIPLLARARAEAPGDFEVSYWLARMLRDAGRLDEALPESIHAVDVAYGPRRLRAWDLHADVLGRKGDRAGERAALEAAIAYASALPKDAMRRPREQALLGRVTSHLAKVPPTP